MLLRFVGQNGYYDNTEEDCEKVTFRMSMGSIYEGSIIRNRKSEFHIYIFVFFCEGAWRSLPLQMFRTVSAEWKADE